MLLKTLNTLVFLSVFLPAVYADAAARPFFQNSPELISTQKMDGVKNFSGATWLPEEGHFLLSSSKPPALHEIAVLGERIRKMRTVKLKGFKTLSGVAYVDRAQSQEEGSRIALTQEAKAEVSFCDLKPGQTELSRGDCKTYKINRLLFWEKTFGISGVTVNRGGDVPVFYFGKERIPKAIYRGFFEDGNWNVRTTWDAEAMMPADSVISDLFYDKDLFVLDGAGARILQMDPVTGQTISEFKFKKNKKYGFSGFCLARRTEGALTLVVSDKNQYFIYNVGVETE